MASELANYKRFIDAIVGLRPAVSARWILEGRRWPEMKESPENKRINELVDSLDEQQKEVLAELLNSTYDSGIHDVLAYLNEEAEEGLRLTSSGKDFPFEPFDTGMHYDFVCRSEGDSWPDERT